MKPFSIITSIIHFSKCFPLCRKQFRPVGMGFFRCFFYFYKPLCYRFVIYKNIFCNIELNLNHKLKSIPENDIKPFCLEYFNIIKEINDFSFSIFISPGFTNIDMLYLLVTSKLTLGSVQISKWVFYFLSTIVFDG